MRSRSICGVGVVACALVAGRAPGAEPDKPVFSAEHLVGEWSQVITRQQKDDTLLVVTFRKNGVCRLDALDRATKKQPTGPDCHLPGVGTWKVEGSELVIVWENWNEAEQRPIEQKDRSRIEKS